MIMPLHQLKPGQPAQVVELRTNNPGRLDRLSAFGLGPGSVVWVEQISPALIFRLGETEISIDVEVAREIWVRAI